MSSSTDIVPCPGQGCNAKLRLNKELIGKKIKCPRCNYTWEWSATPVPETRRLPFRCAENGGAFHVVFQRKSDRKKFRILEIQKLDSPSESLKMTVSDDSEIESLISKLEAAAGGDGTPENTHLKSTLGKSVQFIADEFDFGGWYCPWCGHDKDGEASNRFIRCGTCKECVCGARVIHLEGDIHTFECHDACGGSGRISGIIDSYNAEESTIRRPELKAGSSGSLTDGSGRKLIG